MPTRKRKFVGRDQPNVLIVDITWGAVPDFVIFLHEEANVGHADKYTPSGMSAYFKPTPVEEIKFPELKNAQAVMLTYAGRGAPIYPDYEGGAD